MTTRHFHDMRTRHFVLRLTIQIHLVLERRRAVVHVCIDGLCVLRAVLAFLVVDEGEHGEGEEEGDA